MGKARSVSGRWIGYIVEIYPYILASKIRIFNSNVKAVLLHASESSTFTHRTTNRLQVFINECLRRIVNVHYGQTKSATMTYGQN